MPRPSDNPPRWATDATFPASNYPDFLADGATPHPRAGQATDWSGQATRLTTGLAAMAAAGLIPGAPTNAERFNAWLGQLSEWLDWLRASTEAAIDGDFSAVDLAGGSVLELLNLIDRTGVALLGEPIDEADLTTPGAAELEPTGFSTIQGDLAHVTYDGSGVYRLTGDLLLENLNMQANTSLNTHGCRLIVTNQLTMGDNARIYARSPFVFASLASITVGGAGAGAESSASDTTARNGEPVFPSLGGSGGDGGGGVNGGGGAATPPSGSTGRMSTLAELLSGRTVGGSILFGGGGGGGGLSVIDGAGGGGYGGNGGGVVVVAAKRIVVADGATAYIEADGEDGIDAVLGGGGSPQGGGGGGGGGIVSLLYRWLQLGAGATLNRTANGGGAGVSVGGAPAATAGADGLVAEVQI